MKTVLRSLLVLLLIGVAALTVVVEQSRTAVQKKRAMAQTLQEQNAPRWEAIRTAQAKRLDYYQNLLFLRFPTRLAARLCGFLCQANALAGSEMEFQSFSFQAEASGIRFVLIGTIRAEAEPAATALFLDFRNELEKLDGYLETIQKDIAVIGRNGVLHGFLVKGVLGLE